MSHKCHHPDCTVLVDPSLWGCSLHWNQLPINLKADLKKSYREGQEINKRPNREYLKAALAIRLHIKRGNQYDD
jgi:hypothetical protein